MSVCGVWPYLCLVDTSKETELLLCIFFWILKVLSWKITHQVVPAIALGHWHKQRWVTAKPSREGSLLVSPALCYTGTELSLGEIPKEILISLKNPFSSWKHLLLSPEEQLLWLKVERALSWYSECCLVLISHKHLAHSLLWKLAGQGQPLHTLPGFFRRSMACSLPTRNGPGCWTVLGSQWGEVS